jgi:hypothetical protein
MEQSFGVCLLACIPGRADANERSEMVTQLLFGDSYVILEEREKWIRVSCAHDKYECWVDKGQHFSIDLAEYERIQPDNMSVVVDPVNYVVNDKNQFVPVTAGALLAPVYRKDTFLLAGKEFRIAHSMRTGPLALIFLEDFAQRFLNTPYLWGGRSAFGMDCSGFVQLVFRAMGLSLPRDAKDQVLKGVAVDSLQKVKTGDLAFFHNDKGVVIHVGILLSPRQIIHSSSWVKQETIDDKGIINTQTQLHSHQLHSVRRLI